MEHMDYHERLKELEINSTERMRETYMIIYAGNKQELKNIL